jgi:hypothetical protein
MIKLENKLEWESGELSAPSLLTNILNRVGDLLFPPHKTLWITTVIHSDSSPFFFFKAFPFFFRFFFKFFFVDFTF